MQRMPGKSEGGADDRLPTVRGYGPRGGLAPGTPHAAFSRIRADGIFRRSLLGILLARDGNHERESRTPELGRRADRPLRSHRCRLRTRWRPPAVRDELFGEDGHSLVVAPLALPGRQGRHALRRHAARGRRVRRGDDLRLEDGRGPSDRLHGLVLQSPRRIRHRGPDPQFVPRRFRGRRRRAVVRSGIRNVRGCQDLRRRAPRLQGPGVLPAGKGFRRLVPFRQVHLRRRRLRRHLRDGDGGRPHGYKSLAYMYSPPFTRRTSPVMNDARSEPRQATASAASRAVPARPSEAPSAIAFFAASGSSFVMSVSIHPGLTAFTRTLRLPSSRASDLVNPMSPAFAIEYTV